MVCTTIMNNIIEERYQFCIWLNLIARERGGENQVYVDIFSKPCHIKKLFGDFLGTPQYTELATLRGHNCSVNCFAPYENNLYSASIDKTIRVLTGTKPNTRKEILSTLIMNGHIGVRCLTFPKTKCILRVGISISGFGTQRLMNNYPL